MNSSKKTTLEIYVSPCLERITLSFGEALLQSSFNPSAGSSEQFGGSDNDVNDFFE